MHGKARSDITHIRPDVIDIRPDVYSSPLDQTVWRKKKVGWDEDGEVPSGCTFLWYVSEGFSISEGWSGLGLFGFCLRSLFLLFCFCLVSFGLSGRGSGERNSEAKSPLQGGCTPLFIEGECLGF